MSDKLIITPHAKMRRKQMKITEHEIQLAVDDPELAYSDNRHGEERMLFQRGRIVVITNIAVTKVVTVIWHGLEGRDETPQVAAR